MIVFTLIIVALVYKVVVIYKSQVKRVASKFHLRLVTFFQFFVPIAYVTAVVFSSVILPIYQLYYFYTN